MARSAAAPTPAESELLPGIYLLSDHMNQLLLDLGLRMRPCWPICFPMMLIIAARCACWPTNSDSACRSRPLMGSGTGKNYGVIAVSIRGRCEFPDLESAYLRRTGEREGTKEAKDAAFASSTPGYHLPSHWCAEHDDLLMNPPRRCWNCSSYDHNPSNCPEPHAQIVTRVAGTAKNGNTGRESQVGNWAAT
jgi:hypothetical protein